MIKVFLLIFACQASDYTNCNWMDTIERPDPIMCQMDRIPVSGWWKDEIRRQGFPDWAIFTECRLVDSEKNEGLE